MMLSRVEAWRDILGLSPPYQLTKFSSLDAHAPSMCHDGTDEALHVRYKVQSNQYGSCQPFFHYKSLVFTRVWRHVR